jgi:hypothetical protein
MNLKYYENYITQLEVILTTEDSVLRNKLVDQLINSKAYETKKKSKRKEIR